MTPCKTVLVALVLALAFVARMAHANLAPHANAGPDQAVSELTFVTLNGLGSIDLNDDPLTYSWMQVAGPSVVLNLSNPAKPTFTAPTVPTGGATRAARR
jgi:hypothetical protein